MAFVWIIITFSALCNSSECLLHPPLGQTSATKNQCVGNTAGAVSGSEIAVRSLESLARTLLCGARQGRLGRPASPINSVLDCFPISPAFWVILPWDAWHLKKQKERGEKNPATQALKPWPWKEKACAELCKQSVVCQGWRGWASWAMSWAQLPSHCGGLSQQPRPVFVRWTTGPGWEDAPCPQSETTTTFPAGWTMKHTKCFIKLPLPVRPPQTGQEAVSSDEAAEQYLQHCLSPKYMAE